jgi:hypothetical protein
MHFINKIKYMQIISSSALSLFILKKALNKYLDYKTKLEQHVLTKAGAREL